MAASVAARVIGTMAGLFFMIKITIYNETEEKDCFEFTLRLITTLKQFSTVLGIETIIWDINPVDEHIQMAHSIFVTQILVLAKPLSWLNQADYGLVKSIQMEIA